MYTLHVKGTHVQPTGIKCWYFFFTSLWKTFAYCELYIMYPTMSNINKMIVGAILTGNSFLHFFFSQVNSHVCACLKNNLTFDKIVSL